MDTQEIKIDSTVGSKVLLIGQWDIEDDNYDFSIRYYGTAKDTREVQLQDCLDRAGFLVNAHIAMRLPDSQWIVGKVRG